MAHSLIRCDCGGLFTSDIENAAWEKHRRHAEVMADLGEGGMHAGTLVGKPLTRDDNVSTDLAEVIDWTAKTVHEAYHGEAGGYWRCHMPTCMAATRVLKVHGHEVPMPGVFPEISSPASVGGSDQGAHAEPAQQESQHRLGEQSPSEHDRK